MTSFEDDLDDVPFPKVGHGGICLFSEGYHASCSFHTSSGVLHDADDIRTIN